MQNYTVITNSRIQAFIDDLDEVTFGKMLRSFDLLEKFGGNIGMPHTKRIAKDLYELRLPGQTAVRFFYTVQNKNIIVFHGFIKKTMKIPVKELRTAKQILASLAE